MTGCIALVVASGRGHRFGPGVPKQYQTVAGRPVLQHSLARLAGHPGIAQVRVVIHADDHEAFARAADGLDLLPPVKGGLSRQDSVRYGLESLADQTPATVLIHDGVRPVVRDALIERVLEALREAPAVVPALPVTDTLKRVQGGVIEATVERAGLFRAQTPQGFDYRLILDAHRRLAGAEMTDDSALASACGLPVAVVEGDPDNLKVTEPADLERVERLLDAPLQPRTGLGFDVHRLVPGEGLVLLGVPVPSAFRLSGHSDADVGLHALTDALLGALGAGDIGAHFPPDDARWAGADSTLFLRHARALVERAGGRIDHIDVTLICERPKIGPHRAAMSARIGSLLGLVPSRVSVKATTTEGLGFTGRGEGIAAQAIATVSLPA